MVPEQRRAWLWPAAILCLSIMVGCDSVTEATSPGGREFWLGSYSSQDQSDAGETEDC